MQRHLVGEREFFNTCCCSRSSLSSGMSERTPVSGVPVDQRKEPLRLHIGGEEVKAGWKILNAQALPGVDFVGNCVDLSQFADNTVKEIYASHVYEHLGYNNELPQALREAHRVLEPGGVFRAGVPDLEALCRLFLEPRMSADEKFHVMRMIYGGQVDDYDYHYTGFSLEIFADLLTEAGFKNIRRVHDFGLFRDTTVMKFGKVAISLNVMAVK